MEYKGVKGMGDILPQDAGVWQEIERLARIELESHGYQEIRTPILEETAVFVRSIGETTDIVSKEMFTFSDRKERYLTLRPEGTAPIARAYVEHSLDKVFPGIAKLYYIGPMFRAERPQKGRSRQFHQIGLEMIGSRSPQVDFEAIWRLNRLLKKIGLDGFTIKVNSLGCAADKINFSNKLKIYLKGEKDRLYEDCRIRIEKNVLRVLDCKNESCGHVVKNAPNILDSLCKDCDIEYKMVKSMLRSEKLEFVEAKNLVRGLDYYTGTVFEVTHGSLGGQDALAAGGRYDNLVKEMGGPDAPAVGFAIGIERVIIALGDKKNLFQKPTVLYIATLGHEAKMEGFRLAEKLNEELNKDRFKVMTLVDMEESSLKSQMRNANKNGAKLVLIIGEDELKEEKIVIKEMSGEKAQISIERDRALEDIRKRVC